MYYASRIAAGQELVGRVQAYKGKPTVVMALTNGGVLVGTPIADALRCPLMMLLLKDIELPGERTVLGVIDQQGGFTYNSMFSAGELEYFTSEYHNAIDVQRFEKFHEINEILGKDGLINRDTLRHKNVILVSDGAVNGTAFEAAAEFLKSLKTKRIVAAVPVASVPAVDKMHVLCDEIQILSVTDNYLETNHYYDNNDLPNQAETLELINQTTTNAV